MAAPAAAVARRASTAAASMGSKDSSSSPVAGLTVAMGGPESTACMATSIAHAGGDPDPDRRSVHRASSLVRPGRATRGRRQAPDLAGGRPGQGVDHLVLLGPLVAGQVARRVVGAGGHHVAGVGTGAGHHGGAHPLAPAVVGHAEHGDLGDAGHLGQGAPRPRPGRR